MKVRALTEVSYGADTYNAGDVFTTAAVEHAQELIEQGLVESADADDDED